MRRLFLVAMMLLSACGGREQNPAESYRSGLDQWIVRLGLPNLGIHPCRASLAADKCFKTNAERHWRGTWALGPGEHDERFCVAGLEACRAQPRTQYVLRLAAGSIDIWAVAKGDHATAWTVDFTGRRTTYPVERLGLSHPAYVIVVDRLNFMQPIEFDPEPTETQIENEMKRSGKK